jgi:peptide-methionine (S)-S-oxide reductase
VIAARFVSQEDFRMAMRRAFGFAFIAVALAVPACGPAGDAPTTANDSRSKDLNMPTKNADPANSTSATARATFGGGCFWCIEAVFERIPGVKAAVSGYAGGHVKNPTYEQVCTGSTGHAEVVELEFDPAVVSYEKLLEIFFASHDPTTLNQQGPDVGTQYRSVIFTHDDEQQKLARAYVDRLNIEKAFGRPVVTEVERLAMFYPAEDYHQDYYRNNPGKGYCRMMIAPKLKKLGLEK